LTCLVYGVLDGGDHTPAQGGFPGWLAFMPMSEPSSPAPSPADTARKGAQTSKKTGMSGVSLHTFFSRLIWLCVGPLVLLAAYLAIDRVQRLNDERDHRATSVVKLLVTSIDQDLETRIGALNMLAQSPLIDDPLRWSDLYREAAGFHRSFGNHVVFANLQMNMLFNTRVPFGTPLSGLPRPSGKVAALTAVQSGKPAVGDIFQGSVAHEPLVAVAVPVIREGRVTYLLLSTFETRSFAKYLDEIELSPGWSLVVLDGRGETIARRRSDGATSATAVDAKGRFVVHSSESPWSVVLEIPRDVYYAPLIAAAATLTLAVVGATLAGLVGGTLASRRLGRALASLASPEQAPDSQTASPAIIEIGNVRRRLDDAAERREVAEAGLRNSEERLRFTLDSAHIGSWDLDLITGVNHRSIWHDRCFGYEAPHPLWTFGNFVRHVHPDDRDEVVRLFHAAVAEHSDWHYECRVIWPDASVHWINGHGSTQYEGGKRVRMLGIVTEITHRKLAVESRLTALRLEAENHKIQEASRLKSEFLANMSHELRTPLNAIIGFSELLLAGAVSPESPEHKVFLGHISTSGLHLLQLINDVLDLSKVESGKFEFFAEPVQLPVLIKEVQDILYTQIQQKHIQVTADVDPTLTDLMLDPGRLKQVLYNYLSNALKFTPEFGQVTVRARPEGGAAFRIEVEDNGIGISEADQLRLFTDFLQLDAGSTRQHQGTGLGLALARRLVQAQGGTVGVRSTRGVGSVFYLVMSRAPVIDQPGDAA